MFFPFIGSLFAGTVRVLRMLHQAVVRAADGGFSGRLLFRRKEESAGNALQTTGSSAAADLCLRENPNGDGKWSGESGKEKDRKERRRPGYKRRMETIEKDGRGSAAEKGQMIRSVIKRGIPGKARHPSGRFPPTGRMTKTKRELFPYDRAADLPFGLRFETMGQESIIL